MRRQREQLYKVSDVVRELDDIRRFAKMNRSSLTNVLNSSETRVGKRLLTGHPSQQRLPFHHQYPTGLPCAHLQVCTHTSATRNHKSAVTMDHSFYQSRKENYNVLFLSFFFQTSITGQVSNRCPSSLHPCQVTLRFPKVTVTGVIQQEQQRQWW